MSEPLSCEERGGFCAVRTLSERCQNTVRTLSERCQNGQVSVRTGAGAPQTRFVYLVLSLSLSSFSPTSLEVLEVDILWPRWVARIGVTRATEACFLTADRQCTELPLLRLPRLVHEFRGSDPMRQTRDLARVGWRGLAPFLPIGPRERPRLADSFFAPGSGARPYETSASARESPSRRFDVSPFSDDSSWTTRPCLDRLHPQLHPRHLARDAPSPPTASMWCSDSNATGHARPAR